MDLGRGGMSAERGGGVRAARLHPSVRIHGVQSRFARSQFGPARRTILHSFPELAERVGAQPCGSAELLAAGVLATPFRPERTASLPPG